MALGWRMARGCRREARRVGRRLGRELGPEQLLLRALEIAELARVDSPRPHQGPREAHGDSGSEKRQSDRHCSARMHESEARDPAGSEPARSELKITNLVAFAG